LAVRVFTSPENTTAAAGAHVGAESQHGGVAIPGSPCVMVALELFEVAEGHLLLEGADRAADFRPVSGEHAVRLQSKQQPPQAADAFGVIARRPCAVIVPVTAGPDARAVTSAPEPPANRGAPVPGLRNPDPGVLGGPVTRNAFVNPPQRTR